MSVYNDAIAFLHVLDIEVPIVPVMVDKDGKRPLIKYADHPENLAYKDTILSSLPEYTQKQWARATHYGVVVNKKYTKHTKLQIIILDVDIPTDGGHTEDGRAAFTSLSTSPTLAIQTKSGGFHAYYYAPKKWKAPRAPFPGLDLAGNSPPFVVGPNGNDYTILKDLPIASAGDALLKELQKASMDRVDLKGGVDTSGLIDFIIEHGIPEGERHDVALSIMASLAKQRASASIVRAVAALIRLKCGSLDGAPTMEEMIKMHEDAINKFVDPNGLDDLLDRYVYVSSEERIYDQINRHNKRVSPTALRAMYPQKVPIPDSFDSNGNQKYGPLGSVWIDDTGKTEVNHTVFLPGKDTICKHRDVMCYNEYVSGHIKPADTYNEVYIEKVKRCFKITYGPIFEDFLKVIMYKYHNPGVKFNWCIYVTSEEEGMGKGLSYSLIQRLFGYENCVDLSLDDVGNKFNSSLSRSVFARIDEAQGAITKASRNVSMEHLKRIITEDVMTQERKGVDKDIGVESHFFLFIFSNNKNSVDLNAKSRRFLVYHNEDIKTAETVKLFYEVANSFEDENNLAQILKWMVDTVDYTICDDFNPKGEARKTEDLLKSTQHAKLTAISDDIREAIQNGMEPFDVPVMTERQFDYLSMCQYNARNPIQVRKELMNMGIITKGHLMGQTTHRKYNQHRIDDSLARDNIPIQDAYDVTQPKAQSFILFLKDHEEWIDAPQKELKQIIDKYGPRKSSRPMHSVDK